MAASKRQPVDEFDAFSPTGARIRATLEILTGEHEVRFFVRDGETIVHELGDDYRDNDAETVSIAGETVYIDTKGEMWKHDALTFRARGTGRVVRRGTSTTPFSEPNVHDAMTLGARAEAIRDTIAVQDQPVPSWPQASKALQLTAAGEAELLLRFITYMGLQSTLCVFAASELAKDRTPPVSLPSLGTTEQGAMHRAM